MYSRDNFNHKYASYELDDRDSIPVTSSGIFPFINNWRLLVSYNVQIKK